MLWVTSSLPPAAFPGLAVWGSKRTPWERLGRTGSVAALLSVPPSSHFLLASGRFLAPGSSYTGHLPGAPLWRSLEWGALHPSAAMGRGAPCPSLQDSGWGEDRGMAGCPRVAGGLGGAGSQSEAVVAAGHSPRDLINASITVAAGRAGPTSTTCRRNWGALGTAIRVLWGSVKPGPQFSGEQCGVRVEAHGGFLGPRPRPTSSHAPDPLPESHCP